ncbi:MAG: hypothetical protein M3Z27_02460 [Actinomycetota bacterium]|nr:hypothetical protein [Actinomycetota bacterium]
MSTFTVVPATLDGLASSLEQISGQVKALNLGPEFFQGMLGGDDLELQMAFFCGYLQLGVSGLGDHIHDVVGRLHAGALQYREADAHACFLPGS